jgi:hypothetical protein
MSTAIVNRISPWMMVAVLVALALFALAAVLLYQSGMFHTIGSALQHSQSFASWCGSGAGEC